MRMSIDYPLTAVAENRTNPPLTWGVARGVEQGKVLMGC